jgi:hypothetical protein
MVGQHTQEIMAELGYDQATIDNYRNQGIIGWPGDDYGWPV